MLSYGLIYWILPLSLIIYLINQKIKINIKYKNLLIILGILMGIIELLSLTRRVYIGIIFMIIFLIYLINKFINIKFFKTYLTSIIYIILIITILIILFPKNFNGIKMMFEDIYLLATTGKGIENEIDYRLSLTGHLEYTFNYIKENYIYGIGYIPYTWGESLEKGEANNYFGFAIAASYEVPILNGILQLGILGMLIVLPLYYLPIKLTFKFYKILRQSNFIKIINSYKYEIIFSVLIILLMIKKYTVECYTLFGDFTYAPNCPLYILIVSLLFSLYYKINYILDKEKSILIS